MENRERIKESIREILQINGIADKDKLENIPEVLVSYFGGKLVQAVKVLNPELTTQDVERFMEQRFYGSTQT